MFNNDSNCKFLMYKIDQISNQTITKDDNKITKLMHKCLLNCEADDREGEGDGAGDRTETSAVFSFEQVYLHRLERTTLYTPLLDST